MDLKPYLRNISTIFSLSGIPISISSILISKGTSTIIFASCLLKIAVSLCSSTRFLILLLEISSLLSISSSTVLNSERSFEAVLGPTPGIPGILSELSPLNPLKSIICLGDIPNSSKTKFSS